MRQKGLATGYAAWKPEWIRFSKRVRLKSSTGKPYCWWLRKVKRGDPIIAHRSLPCGMRVYVTTLHNGEGAWLTVGDRGPYGACVKLSELRAFERKRGKRLFHWRSATCKKFGKDWVWYVKRRRRWPGVWRGIADISHTARKLIRHDGWSRVSLRYWRQSKRRKRPDQHQAHRQTPSVSGLALSDARTTARAGGCSGRRASADLPLGTPREARRQRLSAKLLDRRPQGVFHVVRAVLDPVAAQD